MPDCFRKYTAAASFHQTSLVAGHLRLTHRGKHDRRVSNAPNPRALAEKSDCDHTRHQVRSCRLSGQQQRTCCADSAACCACRWIPGTAKFVAVGQHARGTGCLQVRLLQAGIQPWQVMMVTSVPDATTSEENTSSQRSSPNNTHVLLVPSTGLPARRCRCSISTQHRWQVRLQVQQLWREQHIRPTASCRHV